MNLYQKKARRAWLALVLAAVMTGSPLPAHAATGKTVVLGGQPFGVRFFGDGVMVVQTEEFFSGGRYVCPAEDGGLKVGDVIKRVNGTEVKTNEELQQATLGCGGEAVRFTVLRGGKELIKTVVPQQNATGVYLLGAWVRDSCAGIGTVTYYDPQNGSFAALGHGICDRDTAALMPLGSAEVVEASIHSVTKSTPGVAGSLNGCFSDKTLGNLTQNTETGVYGTTNDNLLQQGSTLEIAENNKIHVGKAQLFTTVSGESCACYEAEITRICNCDAKSNENFVIKVTDSELLSRCGGIVQGMSGSPIVQDGKLAGAVTHVFLETPEEGYGIMAQNMVSNYQS
ncbi:MAG: PDZ domain-containing protein [Ruminococcus sp.]|nr:PDZ domain-containing protein [Ruminococcus sp.]